MTNRDIFGKLKVSTRVIAAGLFITGLFILFTYAWLLPEVERTLMAKKQEKIEEATESVWSLLAHYNRLAEEGELTIEEAKETAAASVRDMRYGPEMKDYFWINDMHPVMIAHPYKPELEGTDLSDIADPEGLHLFVAFVRVAKEKGEGIVSYLWQWKDDDETVVPKVSFVRLFRPWGWIVGTGMYTEDIRGEIGAWQIRMGVVSFLLAVVGGLVSWRMGRRVSRHIAYLTRDTQRNGNGNGNASDTAPAWRVQTFILFVTIPAIVLVTLLWAADLYRALNLIIMNGFDRKLAAVSTVTGAFIDGEEHDRIEAIGDEQSDLYQKYVRPMRKILKAAGLTYLYTQILSNKPPDCRYILDATEGEEHSAIGAEDQLPAADYRGGERVQLYGTVHVGEVQDTEKWGPLKSAFAPIYHKNETINAMAGADVNVSIISDKMRVALFAVALVGVAALLLAGYVSVFLSKRIVSPLSLLKEHALSVAADERMDRLSVSATKDLGELPRLLDKIGENLREMSERNEREDRDIEQRRREENLVSGISKRLSGMKRFCSGQGYVAAAIPHPRCRCGSGAISDDNAIAVLWQTEACSSSDEALILKSDLWTIATRAVTEHGGSARNIMEHLGGMLSEDVSLVLVYDATIRTVFAASSTPVSVRIRSAGGAVSTRTLSRMDTLTLKEEETLSTLDAPLEALLNEDGVPFDLRRTSEQTFEAVSKRITRDRAALVLSTTRVGDT